MVRRVLYNMRHVVQNKHMPCTTDRGNGEMPSGPGSGSGWSQKSAFWHTKSNQLKSCLSYSQHFSISACRSPTFVPISVQACTLSKSSKSPGMSTKTSIKMSLKFLGVSCHGIVFHSVLLNTNLFRRFIAENS